jgi:hypothetical protein
MLRALDRVTDAYIGVADQGPHEDIASTPRPTKFTPSSAATARFAVTIRNRCSESRNPGCTWLTTEGPEIQVTDAQYRDNNRFIYMFTAAGVEYVLKDPIPPNGPEPFEEKILTQIPWTVTHLYAHRGEPVNIVAFQNACSSWADIRSFTFSVNQ